MLVININLIVVWLLEFNVYHFMKIQLLHISVSENYLFSSVHKELRVVLQSYL